MTFCIAIDGPAAAGKGTIARALSAHFGLAYLDTGKLYRATALRVIAGADPVAAAQALAAEDLDGPGLRTAEVGQMASKVSAIPEVRAALIAFQKAFARRPEGAVLDGRDIGTVICPDAELKIFVTASDIARARRRHAEFVDAGVQTDFETVLADLRERDARDSSRATAPLCAANDAIHLDTSNLTAEAVIASAISYVNTRRLELI